MLKSPLGGLKSLSEALQSCVDRAPRAFDAVLMQWSKRLIFFVYYFSVLFCGFVYCFFLFKSWTCMMLRATQTLPMKELNKKVCMDVHTGEH